MLPRNNKTIVARRDRVHGFCTLSGDHGTQMYKTPWIPSQRATIVYCQVSGQDLGLQTVSIRIKSGLGLNEFCCVIMAYMEYYPTSNAVYGLGLHSIIFFSGNSDMLKYGNVKCQLGVSPLKLSNISITFNDNIS